MIHIRDIVLVLSGSAVGGTLRYIFSFFATKTFQGKWPWGTFGVNILGCLIIGLVYAMASRNPDREHSIRLLLATGFCGGFTTFSAFAMENFQLIKHGQPILTILYIASSVILGIASVWLGAQIIK